MFSLIEEQLSPAASVLFQQRDFTNATALLEEVYQSMARSLGSVQPGNSEYICAGLNVRGLLLRFRHRLLVLFKLLLLERRYSRFAAFIH